MSFAQVSREQFHLVASDFIDFIIPIGQEVKPEFTRSIVLEVDTERSQQFFAYAVDPILIFEGLIKSSYMNMDAVISVLCHEVSHDKDIADYYLGAELEFAFDHLRQDYFASNLCFRNFIKENSKYQTTNLSKGELNKVPITLKTECAETFKSPLEQNICLRSIFSSLMLTQALYNEVPFTYERMQKLGIPEPTFERDWLGKDDDLQARLINFVNGALNKAPFNE